MVNPEIMKAKLSAAFPPAQAAVLAEIITEAIEDSYKELVKASDFNELKEIVKDLGVKVGDLAKAQKELAEAQKRTEQRVEELAEAQKKTEEAVAKLARGLDATRADLGGLARSVAYSLENEAYRALPALMRQHGIEITERLVRTEVEGEEINVLGKGRRNGAEVLIVGEAELRLTTMNKVRQLLRKADVVAKKYPGEIVKVLITHYARPRVIEKAREQGVLVIQSFEWL